MDSRELRALAQRWRSRAPGADDETAAAIAQAAHSVETIAAEKDGTAPPIVAPADGAFLHRAYDGPTKNQTTTARRDAHG